MQAVNSELVERYWQVGGFISRKIETAAWGEGVVEELARFIARQGCQHMGSPCGGAASAPWTPQGDHPGGHRPGRRRRLGRAGHLGHARVVYGKFPVIRNVVEACDKVRKAESRLNPGSLERLERARRRWRKHPENWTAQEAQRRAAMAGERGAVGPAGEMRRVPPRPAGSRVTRRGCRRAGNRAWPRPSREVSTVRPPP
ncbi:MAG TPA: transposase [Verrucomicrobiota bacterium]|nr:transposase [Verrucomicrobiota bacterium]